MAEKKSKIERLYKETGEPQEVDMRLVEYVSSLRAEIAVQDDKRVPGVLMTVTLADANKEVNLLFGADDAKRIIRDFVLSLKGSGDPISGELFEAFKGVFERRAKKHESGKLHAGVGSQDGRVGDDGNHG